MKRADIIAEAASWIGTPYHHQASLKGVGADCLGLVRGVWRGVYGAEPLVIPAYAQEPNETPGGEALIEGAAVHLVAGTAAPQPGDLLVFRLRENLPARHCGVLIAEDRFVHAVSGRSVSGAAFGVWWRRRLAAHFAFPGLED
jgi:NlpC/P60 family putative phage cell wall peptidase